MKLIRSIRKITNIITKRNSIYKLNVKKTCFSQAGLRMLSTIYNDKILVEVTNKHKSDAEIRIAEVPPIEVDEDIAICDGGGGALGHPLEYIQLNTVKLGSEQTCKYCGLRFRRKIHHH